MTKYRLRPAVEGTAGRFLRSWHRAEEVVADCLYGPGFPAEAQTQMSIKGTRLSSGGRTEKAVFNLLFDASV